jgi:hypothetical protein
LKLKPKPFGIKLYGVLEEKVENGVKMGIYHAHKHVENPSEESIVENIVRDVMGQLDEVIDFGQE